MFKKKKEEYIEDDEDYEDEDEDIQDNFDDFSSDNTATNALHYASIVSTPSETAKHFKHIPKESRYSFFEPDEVKEIKHWDKNYRNYQYMKKVFALQQKEDIDILNNKLKLYEIKNKQDLKEYCKANHLLVTYNKIKDNQQLIKELLGYISTIKKSGFYEDIKNQNECIVDIYNNYRNENEISLYIDDLGMAGNIFANSIVSMGRTGNERHAQVMTISATKDIDMKKQQEEKTEYKNKLGGFINKFR